MDYRGLVQNLDTLAELSNPVKPGDFRDGQGLLHCGKCGALMEHVTKLENIKVSPAFYNDLDEEHKRRVDDMKNWLAGRVHRIPCRCKEAERKAYEKEQRKQYIKDNMRYCFGKTPTLFDYVFELDDSKDTKASQTSRRYADGFKKYADIGWGLIFTGEVGYGKTFYACAVANKLLQDGFKIKFTNVTDIVGQASQFFLPISTVVDNLCENDLIILDDLGAEEMSDKMQAKTYQIINAFYERKKPVIITTNIKADTLRSPPTDETRRIYSRLLERATLCEVQSEKGDRRQSSS